MRESDLVSDCCEAPLGSKCADEACAYICSKCGFMCNPITVDDE